MLQVWPETAIVTIAILLAKRYQLDGSAATPERAFYSHAAVCRPARSTSLLIPLYL